MRLYWEYLVYLFRGVEPLSEQALAEIPYRDALQAPLQPLMDNLESVTYETFEKDASKYIQYEEAVRCALTDLVREGEEGTVMVVGAGAASDSRVIASGDAREQKDRRVRRGEKSERRHHASTLCRARKSARRGASISGDMRTALARHRGGRPRERIARKFRR